MHIILGSRSSRRRELLAGMEFPFTAVDINADEHYPSELTAGDIPLYISRAKADAYTNVLDPDELLITSDTIVWLDGEVMGKPGNMAAAEAMLRRLSGRTHQVYTAVTFVHMQGNQRIVESAVDCTDVTFRPLSDEQIHFYVTHYQPLDKAGAYGIQEWIGYTGVESIHGSFFTVMGFPTHLVYDYVNKLKK